MTTPKRSKWWPRNLEERRASLLSQDLIARVHIMDSRNARDAEYRGLMSTASKPQLAKGETWRDRALNIAGATDLEWQKSNPIGGNMSSKKRSNPTQAWHSQQHHNLLGYASLARKQGLIEAAENITHMADEEEIAIDAGKRLGMPNPGKFEAGVRYKVFAGKEGRTQPKDKIFTGKTQLEADRKMRKFVDKLQDSDNFYEIDSYYRNPGAAWHQNRMAELMPRVGHAMRAGDTTSAALFRERVNENAYASKISLDRGVRNPIAKCPACGKFLTWVGRVPYGNSYACFNKKCKTYGQRYVSRGATKYYHGDKEVHELNPRAKCLTCGRFLEMKSGSAEYGHRYECINPKCPRYLECFVTVGSPRSYAYGEPTEATVEELNPRPPSAWWAAWYPRIKRQYHASKEQASQITAGIWWNLPASTRAKIIGRFG